MNNRIAYAYEGFQIVSAAMSEACHISGYENNNVHWITVLAYLDLHPHVWIRRMIPNMPMGVVQALIGSPHFAEAMGALVEGHHQHYDEQGEMTCVNL